tara:strand:+ start:94 stop:654 length:561 start_codon:yes stop_codon:yes gene_type:complete
MRIIGGNFKGKRILLPSDKNTRPLRDLVKESIFNLLNHSNKLNFEIKDSKILDLFSGTGSFGLECISRGAHNVTFVENYAEILRILKKNILNLNVNKNSEIIEENCFSYIKSNDLHQNKFDLIFIDPPFKEEKINYLIDTIKESKILRKNGILILHRHKKDNIEISKNLKILDQRNYGLSKIILGN